MFTESTHLSQQPIGFNSQRNPSASFADGLALMNSHRSEYLATSPYTKVETARIATESPILIMAIGDIHWGSRYCNTEKLAADLKLLEQTPNTYCVLMGNLIDNGNPSQFPDSMLANTMSPQDQADSLNDRLQELDRQNKILGAVHGPCHEGWTWKKMGIDINKIIYANTKFPLFENGGILKLELPNLQDPLVIALFHQFGHFGSQFNYNHPNQQLQRLVLGGNADVVISGHSHYGEVLQTYYGNGQYRKTPIYIKSGSYKGRLDNDPKGIADVWQESQSGKDGDASGESFTIKVVDNKAVISPILEPETACQIQKAEFEIAQTQALGLYAQAVTSLARKENRQNKKHIHQPIEIASIQAPIVQQVDLGHRPKSAWEKHLKHAAETASIERTDRDPVICTEASIGITTRHPIKIIAFSDLLLGSEECNYQRLYNHLQLLKEVGTYGVFIGELISNPSKESLKPGDVLTNMEQIEALHALFIELGEKNKILASTRLIGLTSPKHRQEVESQLFAGTAFPIMENGGMLNLTLTHPDTMKDISYNLALHNTAGPFESQFSKAHPAQQQQRLYHAGRADAIIMAGNDTGETVHNYYGYPPFRKDVVYIRCGTYTEQTSQEKRFPTITKRTKRERTGAEAEPSGQGLILYPEQRRLIPFIDPDINHQQFKSIVYDSRQKAVQ